MPKAFSESERERIRERMIEAGKLAINARGIKGVVIDDIAREGGISKGSFYSFFPSREDFILSVLESWEKKYRAPLLAEVNAGGGTPKERLERFFLSALEIFDREPGLAKLGMNEMALLIERLPPERVKAHQAEDARAVSSTLADWVQRGLISEVDLPGLSGVLNSLFAIAIHRKDYPAGTYEPTVRLIAEGLAMRLAKKGENDGEV